MTDAEKAIEALDKIIKDDIYVQPNKLIGIRNTLERSLKSREVVGVTVDGFVELMGITGSTTDDLATLKALGVWIQVKYPNGLKIIDG